MKHHLKHVTLLLLLTWFSPFVFAQKKQPDWSKIYAEQLFHITAVMVTDVASPPVAARIYAYTNLAPYRVLQESGAVFQHADILRQSKIMSQLPPLSLEKVASPEFAAIYAMFLVGEKIMPSGYLLREKQNDWRAWGLKTKIVTAKNLDAHLTFAKTIADQVLASAKTDGYLQLTAMTRYTPVEGPGYWYPTPPAYMSAVEPEWKTMRTFFLQDLSDFAAAPMAPFDLEAGSSFQKQTLEVYELGKNLSAEQRLIANFWDCNPFKVEFAGHMAIGVKKISPGGHWMGIAGIAAKKARLDIAETIYLHALLGMTIHDAFVSCWQTKYDTHRIRPETVINQSLDQNWKPLLQTPPFPEYSSGHSVVSGAASVVLTAYFGDNFGFIDSSEVYFGLPEREFNSFFQAADEAAISRLYGGIHFRDAIENGVVQGKKIGSSIWENLKK